MRNVHQSQQSQLALQDRIAWCRSQEYSMVRSKGPAKIFLINLHLRKNLTKFMVKMIVRKLIHEFISIELPAVISNYSTKNIENNT